MNEQNIRYFERISKCFSLQTFSRYNSASCFLDYKYTWFTDIPITDLPAQVCSLQSLNQGSSDVRILVVCYLMIISRTTGLIQFTQTEHHSSSPVYLSNKH